MKKARAENFITRFARVYTPAVCYGALALAFCPRRAAAHGPARPLWWTGSTAP